MNKIKAFGFFSISVLIIVSCNNKPSQNTSATTEETFISKNTDSFNTAFDSVMINYDSLRNAFINWDTPGADKYASLLQNALISVPYDQLHDEDAATKATSIAQNAADGLQTLINIDSINNKRRFFYTVSEEMYHLVKTASYDKAIIYHKKCPMAFNGDRDGWWISETKKIDNPYFGKYHPKYKNAMLECGTVEDSINNMQ
jgi:GTPase SAR1 family protein